MLRYNNNSIDHRFCYCNFNVSSTTCSGSCSCAIFIAHAGAILRNLCFVTKCYKIKQDIMRIKHKPFVFVWMFEWGFERQT